MRIEQLTFTRFLAAISIVVFHFGTKLFPFNLEATNFLFQHANIGVSYFFILSGFVMIVAYGNKDKVDYADYIKKRFARLYPVYLLAILLYLVYVLVKPYHNSNDYKGLFLNIALAQSWVPGQALTFNSPGWSLSVEMFFYLSFPLLYNYFYRKTVLRKSALVVLLVFVISQLLLHYLLYSSFYKGFPSASHDFVHYFPLMHINEFLIGNIAGLFFLHSGYKRKNYDLIIIALTAAVALLLKFQFGISYHNGMLAFFFVPLIFLISLNTGFLTRISNNKLLVFLGEISYGIYILQMPVFKLGNTVMRTKFLNMGYNPGLIFSVNFVLLIVVSAISYKYIEKPVREKLSRMRFGGNIFNNCS